MTRELSIKKFLQYFIIGKVGKCGRVQVVMVHESSKMSVLKTTVRGIVIRTSGNLLNSLLFFIILLINARPLLCLR